MAKKQGPTGEQAEVEAVVEEPQAEIAYHYNAEANPSGGSYPGVPLRDLLASEVEQYPKWIQRSLKKSNMYQAAPGDAEGEGE